MRSASPTLIPLRGRTLPVDDGRPMRPVARGPDRRRLHRRHSSRSPGLVIALVVSVALHLILLAVRFVMPQSSLFKPPDSPLEVILVNAKSADKPVKADAIAQFDLNGGGEHDQGRATSFLPRAAEVSDGEVLKASQAAAQQLEVQQRRLLAQTRETPVAVAPEAPQKVDAGDSTPVMDLTTSMKQIARLEAQIDKQTTDYNKRPRRGYIGPTTRGATYAMYYAQWKDKVERIGTLNYPEEARGRIYGDLTLRVTLNPDGTIYNDEVEVTRSSGSPILDRAARRIVLLGAPYGRFSEELRREYDIFEIFSTFRFTKGDALEMRAEHR
jgi:periplasmic protein TonB